MEKLSFDAEHLARVQALSHSKSSLKRSTRSSIPKSTSRSRVSPDGPDASRGKRVRFAGSASNCELEGNLDGSMLRHEVDGAKTSEFKSFKRLLEKTALNHYLDKVSTSDHNLKKGTARNGKEARSASFSKTTPVARVPHPSPKTVGLNDGGHSGPRHEHKGTFSEKRANLIQLAARTCSQNVDDFLSNRSDFIFEILRRLGVMRNLDKYGKHQKLEQDHFSNSSQKSYHKVEFCDNVQENLITYKPGEYDNLLTWDDTEIHTFSFEHPLKTNNECKLWNSDLFKEKGATLLPDFNNPTSAIDFFNELDCNKYNYHDKAQALLNSPCGIAEIKVFPSDFSVFMGNLYKYLHFNSSMDHKGLHEFYATRNSANTWYSKVEFDSNNSHHMRNHDSFQDDCILPNSYSSEKCFLKEALVPYINDYSAGLYIKSPTLHLELAKNQFTYPLLEWEATAEQELSDDNCLTLKEVDHFSTPLHEIVGLHDEIGSSSFTDIYEQKNLCSLQSCSFDFTLQDLTFRSKLDVSIYPSTTPIPGSLLCVRNSPDTSGYSSFYSDFHFTTARQSDSENDFDFTEASNSFPVNIFGFTE